LKLLNVLNLKSIPVPTHIVVTELDASPEGYRRYRYSAPNITPAATDSFIQPIGWQWNFVGNLSQQMIIDSGNYNSKEIVIKLVTNATETIESKVMLAYLSDCGIGEYTTTKFARTAVHKFQLLQLNEWSLLLS
jgi:hypothetical protein